jgi:preprotein translocase subunit YajC
LLIDFINRLILFAEDPKPAQDPGFGGMLPMLGFMAMIMVLYYLFLGGPQRKEQKRRQELLNNLKKNDRVVTIGGIYGVVMNAKREADEVVLKVDESNDTKIRVTYNAVARVIVDQPAEEKK